MPTARNTTPVTIASTCDWLNMSSTRSWSLRPAACDTTVVVPTPSIWVSARTMKVRLPAMPTAATASVPSRPTQYRSTRKYSVWKTMATSMKLVVLSRCLVMGPVVMSCMRRRPSGPSGEAGRTAPGGQHQDQCHESGENQRRGEEIAPGEDGDNHIGESQRPLYHAQLAQRLGGQSPELPRQQGGERQQDGDEEAESREE